MLMKTKHFHPETANRIKELQSNRPTVSIVIPAYNEEKCLLKTLDSISKINTVIPVEIIGVDNCSTDQTSEIFNDHHVRWIYESRKGLRFARTTGIRHARGSIILQLDADVLVPPTWVDAHYHEYANDAVIAVSAMSRAVGMHPLIWLWCRGSKWYRSLLGQHIDLFHWTSSNSSYRKDFALQIIDDYCNYPYWDEDVYLIEQLKNLGLVITNLQNPSAETKIRARKLGFRYGLRMIKSSIMRKIIPDYPLPTEPLFLKDVR